MMICIGITHCRKCMSRLYENEYGLCNACRTEEIANINNIKIENHKKFKEKQKYEIKRIGRLALGYKTFIGRNAREDEIEICMWDDEFTHRWTIASFEYNEKQDLYYLECSEYLVDVQDWIAFGALVTGGFKFLNKEI